jgi:5-methylcytosine-specific restriction endonuclease McrA
MIDRTEYSRQWHQKNKLARNRSRMERYYSNKSKEIAAGKLWASRNRDKTRKASTKYRSKPEYKEYNRIRMLKYRQDNRGIVNSIAQKRRAFKRNTTVDMDRILEWMKLVHSKPTFICQYCKTEYPTNRVHFDHIVPLCRGGVHSIENLCASCPSCNLSKGKKLLSEWTAPIKSKELHEV